MRAIVTDNYGPAIVELLTRAKAENRPRTLIFSEPDRDAKSALQALSDATISRNRRVRMPHDAQALRAALWLLFDFMPESHDISQAIATPSGSYWHGILHRREPDAMNAKYWMARVGEHPVFPELLDDAREIAGGTDGGISKRLNEVKSWEAPWFVDQCCAVQNGPALEALLEIQRREWTLLFDYNFGKAFA